jgi:hypothetical protein
MGFADYDCDSGSSVEKELKPLLNLIGLPSGWFGRINMYKQMFVIFRIKGAEHYMTYIWPQRAGLSVRWVNPTLRLEPKAFKVATCSQLRVGIL